MDADHLDIYHTHNELIEHYYRFAKNTKPGGKVIHRSGLNFHQLQNAISFGVEQPATHEARHIRIEHGQYVYEWHLPNHEAVSVALQVPGKHNIENALAASAVAFEAGVKPNIIAGALASFKGVARRFDRKVNGPKHYYIDDYAHHPAELRACITAARELFPDKKITGLFQPHLFSRTADFMDDFASSLSLLDNLMLLDIYPAREKPIPGVTSKALLHKCLTTNKILLSKEEVQPYLEKTKPEVLISLGAGNIDQLVVPLTKQIALW